MLAGSCCSAPAEFLLSARRECSIFALGDLPRGTPPAVRPPPPSRVTGGSFPTQSCASMGHDEIVQRVRFYPNSSRQFSWLSLPCEHRAHATLPGNLQQSAAFVARHTHLNEVVHRLRKSHFCLLIMGNTLADRGGRRNYKLNKSNVTRNLVCVLLLSALSVRCQILHKADLAELVTRDEALETQLGTVRCASG